MANTLLLLFNNSLTALLVSMKFLAPWLQTFTQFPQPMQRDHALEQQRPLSKVRRIVLARQPRRRFGNPIARLAQRLGIGLGVEQVDRDRLLVADPGVDDLDVAPLGRRARGRRDPA